MIFFDKKSGEDFTVLFVTDPQMEDYSVDHYDFVCTVLENTVNELVRRVKPDLIVCAGDIAYGKMPKSYHYYADFMKTVGIPWTLALGNHDNEDGQASIDRLIGILSEDENFRYEKCAPSLGNGNYVAVLREGGKPVHAVIMMDTHNWAQFGDLSGYDCIWKNQQDWYREQIKALREICCNESTIVHHTPIYAYNYAVKAAVRDFDEYANMMPADVEAHPEIWNKGYENSFGVCGEKTVSTPPVDEGFFDVILDENHTKTLVAGHDHYNSFCITYNGVRFAYCEKTGPGAYWKKRINGGTVMKINADGVYDFHNEYVYPDEWIKHVDWKSFD